jgi:hypothetical protein
LSHLLVPARAEPGDAALMSVLKSLEIQKTLGTEPVLTALRHFPARPAEIVPFPEALHPRLREALAARGRAAVAIGEAAPLVRAALAAAEEGCGRELPHARRVVELALG